MEGSTLAKLYRERSLVSHRVAQVRRQRSPDAGSGSRPDRRPASGRTGGATATPTWRTEPEVAAPAESAQVTPISAVKRPVVAITGAAHGLGLALTARLAASDLVGRVVAIDGSRGDVSGVTWRIVDVR